RYYRDARITNIYEGTTQLQVVAAIRHVLTGTYLSQIKVYQEELLNSESEGLKRRLVKLVEIYEQLIPKVADTKDNEYIDFQSRRLVECAGHIVLSYLLLLDVNRNPEEFTRSAEVYVTFAEAEVKKIEEFINGFDINSLKHYKQV
ncbi:MAG: acyl-CoA dehydrogenase, partial [Prevotellaceae bacterium]|nr:acyl-CoA dehydrogenase [Prevotellaceae bacterium]